MLKSRKTFIQHYEQFFDGLRGVFLYPIKNVGAFVVAFMPALFSAIAVYHDFADTTQQWLAVTVAIVVGLALEISSINAIHSALDLFNSGKRAKGVLMSVLAVLCLSIITLVIANSEDTFSPLIKWLGMAAPALTGIVYLAIGFTEETGRENRTVDLERESEFQLKQAQYKLALKQKEREFELRRDLELQKLQNSHEKSMAKLQTAGSADTPQNTPQSSQNLDSANHFQSSETPQVRKIEMRRGEVLRLKQEGKTHQEIAESLGISTDTVGRDVKQLNGQLQKEVI